MSAFSPKITRNPWNRIQQIQSAYDGGYDFVRTLREATPDSFFRSFGLGTSLREGMTPPIIQDRNRFVDALPIPGIGGFRNAVSPEEAERIGLTPITEEEYRASPNFREAIPYEPGMSEQRAGALADSYDRTQAIQYMSRNQPVALFGAEFAGQFFDPINFIPVLGPATRAWAVARAGALMGRVAVGAGDAMLNTALFSAMTLDTRRRFGDDVSFQAIAMEIAMSALIGGAFGAGAGAFAMYRDRSIESMFAPMRAEERARMSMSTAENMRNAATVTSDAAASLAETGQVVLPARSENIVKKTLGEVSERTQSARDLAAETANVTGNRAGEVVITPSGTRVNVAPEVVELADLIAASDALQVRDRSRAASTAQIEDIAINLDPDRLMPNVSSDLGAPIVGPDNVIDSGNGRVAAIKRASEAYPERYAAYRKAIIDAGYDVSGFETPVLVSRRTTDLSPDARAQFNAESNTSSTARMSATEIAAMDRGALTDSVMAKLNKSGVTAVGNRGFINGFLDNLPQNERSALVDDDGILNADGLRRVENALVAKAYGDVDATVVARFAEATDDNTRSIVGAMSDVAGEWITLRNEIKKGNIGAEFDTTPDLVEALRRISGWRDQAAREGRPVSKVISEGLSQIDAFNGEIDLNVKAYAQLFYNTDHFATAAGRKRIAGRLLDIVRATYRTGETQLFGADEAPYSPLEIIQYASNDNQGSLFEGDGDGGGSQALRQSGRPAALAQDRGQSGQGSEPLIGGERSEILNEMQARFERAGRASDEAEAAAAVIDAFYRTQASRYGVSVDDLLRSHALPVVRAADDAPGAMMQAMNPKGAVRSMWDNAQVNPFNDQEMVFASGDAYGGVTLRAYPDSIWISDLRAITRGGGRVALQRVVDIADEYGTPLELQAHPMESSGGKKMSLKDLQNWYRGFGFEEVDGGVMRRAPAVRPTLKLSGSSREMYFQQAPSLDSPAFKSWFGDSKVVDENGAPLVVYHGTTANFDEFGVPSYFTSHADEASAYTNWRSGVKREQMLARKPYVEGSGAKFDRSFVRYIGIISDAKEIGAVGDVWATDNGIVRLLDKGRVEYLTDLIIDPKPNSFDGDRVRVIKGDGRKHYRKALQERREFIERRFPSDESKGGAVYPVYLSIKNPKKMSPLEANRFGARLGGTPEAAREAFDELKAQGFDGIETTSDEALTNPELFDGEAPRHWIPFSPTQIKSVANRGTFDPADPRILFQSAYHGSPHQFDRFSMDAIGSGEGAQSFGYGLYFSSKREVAEWYREVLTEPAPEPLNIGGRKLDIVYTDELEERFPELFDGLDEDGVNSMSQALATLQSVTSIQQAKDLARFSMDADARRMFDRKVLPLLEETPLPDMGPGRLFEVDIPGDDELLAWELPLSEQPPKVQEVVKKLFGGEGVLSDRTTGQQIYNLLRGAVSSDDGWTMIGGFSTGSDITASKALGDAGIPGLRYLDGFSRPRGDGTYNYVIWNEDAINVLAYEQAARGAIQFGDNGQAVISLFNSADASTALHESGHMFLSMFKSMAEHAAAPPDLKADWRLVKNWWDENADAVAKDAALDGVTGDDVRAVLRNGTTGDRVKDLAIDVGLHEQWARGFEAYVRDGKAPSEGLRGVFEQFKRWLVNIYNTMAELNVRLSPEIKGVFARMLSVDAVQRAERAAEFAPRVGRAARMGDIPPELHFDLVNNFKLDRPALEGDAVFAPALANQNMLDSVGFAIADILGVEFKTPGVKRTGEKGADGRVPLTPETLRAAVDDKMARKRYQTEREITDLVRGGFLVQTPDQADAVIDTLARSMEVLDEGWNITPEGYFDRKALVRFDDGFVGEVQIWHPQMLWAKQEGGGHNLYEKMRQIDAGPERDAMIAAQRELYGSVLEHIDPSWARALGDIQEALAEVAGRPASGNFASNVRSLSRVPDSPISTGSALSQLDLPDGINQPAPESMMAGRPSQSMNSLMDSSSAAPWGPRPDDAANFTKPQPWGPPEGIADEAGARVGQDEDLKALAEQFGVDAMTGEYLEAFDIEEMRAAGRITHEELLALEAADQAYEAAEAYGNTVKAALNCMVP